MKITELFLRFNGERTSYILVEIPEAARKWFLKALPPEFIASKFIEFMDLEHAANVETNLDEEGRLRFKMKSKTLSRLVIMLICRNI